MKFEFHTILKIIKSHIYFTFYSIYCRFCHIYLTF
nr:MAG TPA: protein of unknown function (DUF2024) [Ackermannviridae sp.]